MKRNKIHDFFLAALFVAGFLFIGSGAFECCIIKLLEVIGK